MNLTLREFRQARLERAGDIALGREDEARLVVTGRRHIALGEDDEPGEVPLLILNIGRQHLRAEYLARPEGGDGRLIRQFLAHYLLDRARRGESGDGRDTWQEAVEKAAALPECLRM